MPQPPSRAAAVAREVVRRALGDALRAGAADRLDAAIDQAVTDAAQLEASVRWRGGDVHRGGRLMIEAVPFDLVTALAEATGIPLPPLAARLADLARAERLPLIGGFDVGAAPLVKLYLNASDASASVRRRLREQAGIATSTVDAPHVIGLNARADGRLDLKLYQQGQDEAQLAARVAEAIPFAPTLARASIEARASAGAVVCWDASPDGSLYARAFFIAAPQGNDEAVFRVVRALPGFDAEAVASAVPFPPGPVRSIGVTAGDPPLFTLYFKPRGTLDPVASLEPRARFRAGAAEVGIFIAPLVEGARAYARTARHALSYRCREGEPDRASLAALMLWVGERVRVAEARGADPDLESPPSPWHVVDA